MSKSETTFIATCSICGKDMNVPHPYKDHEISCLSCKARFLAVRLTDSERKKVKLLAECRLQNAEKRSEQHSQQKDVESEYKSEFNDEIASSLTHQQLLEWQFQNQLDDTWWLAISGHSAKRHYSLLEVKALKESSPNSVVSVLHAVYTDDENPQWVDYEIVRATPLAPPPLPTPPPSPIKVKYIANKIVFYGTLPLMTRLAVKAVQSHNYKLDNVNDTIGLVTFSTGMTFASWSGASCSLHIEEVEQEHFKVSGAGKQNVSGMQMAALDFFGEAQGIANKVIGTMRQIASSQ